MQWGKFVRNIFGHILPEFNIIGHGILGNMLAAMRQDLLLGFFGGVCAGYRLYKGLDLLHLVGVGHPDDAASWASRMFSICAG